MNKSGIEWKESDVTHSEFIGDYFLSNYCFLLCISRSSDSIIASCNENISKRLSVRLTYLYHHTQRIIIPQFNNTTYSRTSLHIHTCVEKVFFSFFYFFWDNLTRLSSHIYKNNFLPFHGIVFHILVNKGGWKGAGEKMTYCGIRGKESENVILRRHSFWVTPSQVDLKNMKVRGHQIMNNCMLQ